MKRLLPLVWMTAALLAAPATQAADVTIFESCVDSRGQTLQAYADEQQAELVRLSTDEQGKAAIRYNPTVLPRLGFIGRLFLYTHACARHGLAGGKSHEMSMARSADCMAVSSMLADGMVTREDLPSLQGDLAFSDDEWKVLPGPKRAFELTTCRQLSGDSLKLPVADNPSPQQTTWNGCERGCADKLWTCQKRCARGECDACLDAHRQCRTNCGGSKATP